MTQYAISQDNSQTARPLIEGEKRQVLDQLYELRACRNQVTTYDQALKSDRKLDEMERANYDRALELEKQATALAQKERDLEKEKAAFYEQAYKALTKKPGAWCSVKKIFTLGMARCR